MDPGYINGGRTAGASSDRNLAGEFTFEAMGKGQAFIHAHIDPTFEIIPRFGVGQVIQGKRFCLSQIWLMDDYLFIGPSFSG